ncbi:MAG: hypothetical protein E7476_14070 [Ruminococcaceae bacterium]|nr:hypothetical protein [Oscillospiraceae bacterium]
MKEEKENYRYRPASGPSRKPGAEEERERYYELVRLKLSTGRLHRISAVNIAVILGVIAFLFLGSLLFPKPVTSAVEKRALARMPKFSTESLFHGKLTRDIETFYADTFPMRDQFVSLSAVLNEQRGIRVDNVRIVAPSGGETQDIPSQPQVDVVAPASSVPETQETESSSSEASSVAPPPPSTENETVGPVSNGMFVYKGMAMSLFGGSDQMARWYADVVNTYQRELPGVQVYDMIIPTAIEFYVPDKYRDLTASQKRTMDIIYDALDSNVKKVDAYLELQQHTDEYLYFRTDHHWTVRGAYYAYQAFCQQAGFTPIRLEDCETRRLDNFIGTMYAQTQDSTLLQNPDYVEYFIFPQSYQALLYARNSPYYGVPCSLWAEYAKSPNSYSVFLAGDYPLIQVKTDIHNGRKIMIVKESFGNAFAPYLINHYEEVYIVDQRYFQLASVEFIKEHGINELIFANNSFAACTPYHIRCIDNMRHQPYVPYVPPEAASSQEEETSSSEDSSSGTEDDTDRKEAEKKQKEELTNELHKLIRAKNNKKDS